MCLLLLGVDVHPDYALVVAANRDEHHGREADPAGFWPDAPEVLGGRDRLAGGTWLAVTTAGRFAAVTNIRDMSVALPEPAPSRGMLTTDFVRGSQSPASYVLDVTARAGTYAGFNLVAGVVAGGSGNLWHCDNGKGHGRPTRLPPGVHAVSNASLDTAWPKTVLGGDGLADILRKPRVDPDDLLALLADRTIAPDDALPDTGFGPEFERMLSPVFVAGVPAGDDVYGTRCSTALLLGRDGRGLLVEQSFSPGGQAAGTRQVEFQTRP